VEFVHLRRDTIKHYYYHYTDQTMPVATTAKINATAQSIAITTQISALITLTLTLIPAIRTLRSTMEAKRIYETKLLIVGTQWATAGNGR